LKPKKNKIETIKFIFNLQITKMIIAIDLDDTVADTTGAQCEALGIKLEDIKYDEHGESIVSEELEKKTRDWLASEGTFANLKVIEGAKEAIKAM
jgi:5'(3')-deoxyribonucleotidase